MNEANPTSTVANAVQPTPAPEVSILEAIQILFPHTKVELRIPRKAGTLVGYFDEPSALASTIEKYSGKVPAVYYGLNPACDEIPVTNTAQKGSATSGSQITSRRWLLIDCDPIRLDAEGKALKSQTCSSTDSEKASALAKMKEVHAYLKSLRWAAPLSADSGNGYHLLYRLELSNTPEVTKAIDGTLVHLAQKFNTSQVKIDTTVFDPSRITKAYGSLACKGENTVERPHRISTLRKISLAGGKIPVRLEQLQALAADVLPKDSQSTGKNIIKAKNLSYACAGSAITPEKMEECLDYFDVHFKPAQRNKENTKWIWLLEEPCPFNEEHTSVSVTLGDDGVLGYNCFHNSCQDKHWSDYKAYLETKTGKKFFFQSNKPALSTGNTSAVWKKVGEFKPEVIEWLWKGKLPRRANIAFAGEQSIGKSLFTYDIIARGSVGADWCDGTKNPFGEFSSILLSAEDDVNTVIVPRLLAAGGNPDKVYILPAIKEGEGENEVERVVRLATDIHLIKEKLQQDKTIKLIVIDPLSNYCDGKNINLEQEIRSITMPLARLAQDFDIVIILVFHHTKVKGSTAQQKVIGAGGNIGACRLGWTFIEDKETGERFILQMKENLGKFNGMKYTTEEVPVLVNTPSGGQVETGVARFKYLGKSTESVAALMAKVEAPKDVTNFLTEQQKALAKFCPVGMESTPVSEIYANMSKSGVDVPMKNTSEYSSLKNAFDKARKKLNILAHNIHGVWYWSRPSFGDTVTGAFEPWNEHESDQGGTIQ